MRRVRLELTQAQYEQLVELAQGRQSVRVNRALLRRLLVDHSRLLNEVEIDWAKEEAS